MSPDDFDVTELRALDSPDQIPAAWLDALGLVGLHCGCGMTLKRGCLNNDIARIRDASGNESVYGRVSLCNEENFYLCHDARKVFPINDECFEWVYCEHFVEQLRLEECVNWLAEVKRLLKPGGLLRISTPDLRKYIRAFADADDPFFEVHRDRLLGRSPRHPPLRRAWMMNQLFYFWGHSWIYDLDELVYAASAAGFPDCAITEVGFRQGRLSDVAGLDLPIRSHESFYVEIVKPIT